MKFPALHTNYTLLSLQPVSRHYSSWREHLCRRGPAQPSTMGLIWLALLSILPVKFVLGLHPVDWTWRSGRATHYGGPNDGWSIHQGSCQYYYLDPSVGTGWDICAPADANWDFDGSAGCGQCYEVACNPEWITDGYGNKMDRTSVCYDSSSSVILTITDTCPCYYPSNMYSNKRWCCGDSFHLDMSVYAFEKLAATKWGVIGIKYRRVPCNYQPSKRAYLPSGVSPTPSENKQPWGWSPSMDRRPPITGITTSSAQASASSWSSSYSSGSSTSSAIYIYNSGLQQGWTDASYNTDLWDKGSSQGSSGSTAYCTTVSAGGGVSFSGWKGAFVSKHYLQLWVKKNSNGGVPDFSAQLLGTLGACREIGLPLVTTISYMNDWMQITIPLNAFSWWSPDWSSNAQAFKGCTGNPVDPNDVTTIQLKNNWGSDQWLCLDKVQLM